MEDDLDNVWSNILVGINWIWPAAYIVFVFEFEFVFVFVFVYKYSVKADKISLFGVN